VLTDNDSTDSDDDLSQDRDADFDNADDLLMKVVNQDNTDQFIKEQRDDLSLKPFWDMAEKHIGGMFVKNGLLYHQENVGGIRAEQLAVPESRRRELVRLVDTREHRKLLKDFACICSFLACVIWCSMSWLIVGNAS